MPGRRRQVTVSDEWISFQVIPQLNVNQYVKGEAN
jgi:hypothetical protein